MEDRRRCSLSGCAPRFAEDQVEAQRASLAWWPVVHGSDANEQHEMVIGLAAVMVGLNCGHVRHLVVMASAGLHDRVVQAGWGHARCHVRSGALPARTLSALILLAVRRV